MRSRPYLLAMIAAVVVLSALPGSSAAIPNPVTIWVSPTGNNATCKVGNSSKPCLTVTKAYTLVSPGSTIYLKSGTYGDQTVAYSSTKGKTCATKDVVVRPATTATVTMGFLHLGTYGATRPPCRITINGYHRLTIPALEIGYDGTPANRSSYTTVMNVHITALTWYANALVAIESADNFTLKNSEVGPSAPNSDAIDIVTGNTGHPVPSNILIDQVYVHDLYDSCTTELPSYLVGCSGTGFGDTPPCSGGTCNHVDGLQAYGCNTCTVRRSQFYLQGAAKQGVFWDTEVHSNTLSNITMTNNYLSTGFGFTQGYKIVTPTQSAFGYFNIDYNTIDGVISFAGDGGDPTITGFDPGSTLRMVGNIITGQPGYINPQTKCTATWKYVDGTTIPSGNFVWSNNLLGDGSTCGTGDISGTPTFVQRTWPGAGTCNGLNIPTSLAGCSTTTGQPNLDLSGAQPAIDGGEATYCPYTDIHGTQRPVGAACDIGADEAG